MTADRLRATMRQYRHGISKDDHKARLGTTRVTAGQIIRAQRSFEGETIEALRVDRTPCPRCGIRADIGCAHSALSAKAAGGR